MSENNMAQQNDDVPLIQEEPKLSLASYCSSIGAPSPYKTPIPESSSFMHDWENTPSPLRYNCGNEGSSCYDDDDPNDVEAEELFQNPEPPKELIEQHLMDADNIGNTVFSKHWVFTTLMKLLKVVGDGKNCSIADTVTDAVGDVAAASDAEGPSEIDDNLQDDLCKLWDMSMNHEVIIFLMQYKAVAVLGGVVTKSKSSRVTEVCVGILGNMVCLPSVCAEMGKDLELVKLLLLLLESPDTPTLIETMRLLGTCVSGQSSESWISAIKEASHVHTSILFILQSSTNTALLKSTAEFVDKLMEADDEICSQWSCPELVLAVMEAIKQTGSHEGHAFEPFLHALQLVSTTETGVQALVMYAGEVCLVSIAYLKYICKDDIVGVEGKENIICSALSILGVIFPLWEGKEEFLMKDYQLVRCLLKILDVVYPKRLHLIPVQRDSRYKSCRRFDSVSETEDDAKIPDKNKSESTGLSELNTNGGSDESSEQPSEQCRKDAEEQTDIVSCTKNIELAASVVENGGADNLASKSPTSEEIDAEDHEYRQKMLEMIYELMQALLIDVVRILKNLVPSDLSDQEEGKDSNDDEPASRRVPMTLVYFDSMCDHVRLQYMLHTLKDSDNKDCVGLLLAIGLKYNLKRMCRIVTESILSGSNLKEALSRKII